MQALAISSAEHMRAKFANQDGEFHLVPVSDIQSIKTLIRAAKGANPEQRMRVVGAVLDNLDVNSVPPGEWLKVFEAGNEAVRRTIAVSARLARVQGGA